MANVGPNEYRVLFANNIIRQHLADAANSSRNPTTINGSTNRLEMPIDSGVRFSRDQLPRDRLESDQPGYNFDGNQWTSEDLTVGIIGAGTAGLFTAMIFDYLCSEIPELNVKCEIMEGASRERLGGRCYTYKFPNGGDHDYYDVGAMRFPKVKGVMERFVFTVYLCICIC